MNTLNKSLMVVALLIGTTSAMAIEPVAGSVIVQKEIVRFDDLNLASRAGAATLHWRLRMAARNVCVPGTGLTAHQRQSKCRIEALERALAAVPAVVAAYHMEWKADGAKWLAVPSKSAPTQMAAAR
jgi:UrcA family protein